MKQYTIMRGRHNKQAPKEKKGRKEQNKIQGAH